MSLTSTATQACLLNLALLLSLVNADIYMHNPAGSNNRNRERAATRNNNARLFDSQNNDKGGYPWQGDRTASGALGRAPDPMTYYVGSTLQTEWTIQHGCGDNPSTTCDLVIQYACEDTLPGLRDGWPTGGLTEADPGAATAGKASGWETRAFKNNVGKSPEFGGDGTDRISCETKGDIEYGMHESFEYWQTCAGRQRNHGLYTADQKLCHDAGATSTRQNPKGNRSGFECPEERDYWPYWAPTPWRDVAVFPSDPKKCDELRSESQNVAAKGFCTLERPATAGCEDVVPQGPKAPIAPGPCAKAGGSWKEAPAWGTDPPHCAQHARLRQNFLGDVDETPGSMPGVRGGGAGAKAGGDLPEEGLLSSGAGPARFDWTVPGDVLDATGRDSALCVMRMRYNISSFELFRPASPGAGPPRGGGSIATALPFDASENCKAGSCGVPKLVGGARPRGNRPYVQAFDAADPELAIALNTNQVGRTFQDRSHVFRIARRPRDVPDDAPIVNCNVRGKRGNIVQNYPALEYNFVPPDPTITSGTYLHFQWSGSDFNVARNPNDGEGWQFSDRSNLVQIADMGAHFPLPATDAAAGGQKGAAEAVYRRSEAGAAFFSDAAEARKFALLGQSRAECGSYSDGGENEQNAPNNCGKLNMAPAHFDGGLFRLESRHEGKVFSFMSTRNSNFSNRMQKWRLTVVPGASHVWLHIFVVAAVLCSISLVVAGVYHRHAVAGAVASVRGKVADGLGRCRDDGAYRTVVG
jgi:hypothetical protein